MGILFSLTMGLSFLGLGLFSVYGISDNDVRGLLWGSLNFCRWNDFRSMVAAAGCGNWWSWRHSTKSCGRCLFSRLQASAAGVAVTPVWTVFLILTSAVLTVNFQTVGGLMIYSLLSNPAVAAFLLVKGYGRALALAAAFGLLSGLGGFLLAAATDLPTGAMIVLLSSLLVGVAWAIRAFRRRLGY